MKLDDNRHISLCQGESQIHEIIDLLRKSSATKSVEKMSFKSLVSKVSVRSVVVLNSLSKRSNMYL
jgi:hypothetical protein